MNQTTNKFILDGFQVEISLESENFLIQAQDLSNKCLFSVRLNNDMINKVTKGIFGNIDTMYSEFLEILQGTHTEPKININKEAKLTYKRCSETDKSNGVHFEVELEEMKLDPLAMIQKQMAEMMNKFESKIFDKLKTLEQRMVSFESKREKIEEEIHGQNCENSQMSLTDKLSSLEEKLANLEKGKGFEKSEK